MVGGVPLTLDAVLLASRPSRRISFWIPAGQAAPSNSPPRLRLCEMLDVPPMRPFGGAGSASPPVMRPTSFPSGQRVRRCRPDTGRQRGAPFVYRRRRRAAPACFPGALRLRRPTRHARFSHVRFLHVCSSYATRISPTRITQKRMLVQVRAHGQRSAGSVAFLRPRWQASPRPGDTRMIGVRTTADRTPLERIGRDRIGRDRTGANPTGSNPTPARQHMASFSIHPDLSI
jgi:hypothetical protein